MDRAKCRLKETSGALTGDKAKKREGRSAQKKGKAEAVILPLTFPPSFPKGTRKRKVGRSDSIRSKGLKKGSQESGVITDCPPQLQFMDF